MPSSLTGFEIQSDSTHGDVWIACRNCRWTCPIEHDRSGLDLIVALAVTHARDDALVAKGL